MLRKWIDRHPVATVLGGASVVTLTLAGLRLAGLARTPWWVVFLPFEVIAAAWLLLLAVILGFLGSWGRRDNRG